MKSGPWKKIERTPKRPGEYELVRGVFVPAIVDTHRMAETGTGSVRSMSGDGARSAIAQVRS